MQKNEIKKALYKQKPEAKFEYTYEDNKYYSTEIILDGEAESINFKVPKTEAEFGDTVEAQLLIRWLFSGYEL